MSEKRKPKIFSVSDLTTEIKGLLEDSFDFIWVEAEISNFVCPASGHYYMVLKDPHAQIRAVMFRPQTRLLKFKPDDGMKILAQGRVTVYQLRGEYQIILDYIEPLGIGALTIAFEQLKKKLAEKGIFDKDIKRDLPFLPQKIAVITSPTGAAIRDFLKVLLRRFGTLEIIIVPVKVQGEEASSEIVDALKIVNQELDADVIVLTRGGGSFEDLNAFNQEELAYAIRESNIPVVSAVGHEIDVTISDLAADLRAPTPSAAAEMIVVEKEFLLKQINDLKNYVQSAIKGSLESNKQDLAQKIKRLRDPRKDFSDAWLRLEDLYSYLIRFMKIIVRERQTRLQNIHKGLLISSPLNRFPSILQKINFQKHKLLQSINKRIDDKKNKLSIFEQKIGDLSPLSVLKRGYSITRVLPGKQVLTDSSSVATGDKINVVLADGEIDCTIDNLIKE